MIYFLVGYMASGKTTLAEKISAKYKIPHIDTDSVIEYTKDMSVTDIFEIEGEGSFRQLETKILQEIINDKNRSDIIVSCGGGMPAFNNNMDLMNKNGITIYIKCRPETILSRLSDEELEKRPLLKNKTNDELLSIIKSNIEKREEFYNKANITINYETINIEWP